MFDSIIEQGNYLDDLGDLIGDLGKMLFWQDTALSYRHYRNYIDLTAVDDQSVQLAQEAGIREAFISAKKRRIL